MSAEAGGAAMELRGLRAGRTGGAGRTGRRELWFGAPRHSPLARRADYKSHEALRPGDSAARPRADFVRSGKDPHPGRYHKLSRIQPLEKNQ